MKRHLTLHHRLHGQGWILQLKCECGAEGGEAFYSMHADYERTAKSLLAAWDACNCGLSEGRPMDIADRATPEIESALAEARWQAQRAPALKPKGACHFCDEPVEGLRLYCDKACQEDAEIEEEAFKRIGRRGP